MRNKKRFAMMGAAAVVAIAAFIAVGGVIVLQLWNWLAPALFGWRAITFWQALGLLALCRILFGGFGFGRAGGHGFRRHWKDRCDMMTPEERERFRARMRGMWGVEERPGEQH